MQGEEGKGVLGIRIGFPEERALQPRSEGREGRVGGPGLAGVSTCAKAQDCRVWNHQSWRLGGHQILEARGWPKEDRTQAGAEAGEACVCPARARHLQRAVVGQGEEPRIQPRVGDPRQFLEETLMLVTDRDVGPGQVGSVDSWGRGEAHVAAPSAGKEAVWGCPGSSVGGMTRTGGSPGRRAVSTFRGTQSVHAACTATSTARL